MDVWLARAPFLEQVPLCLLVDHAGVLQGRPDRLALGVALTALGSAPRVVEGRRRLSKQFPRLYFLWKLARDLFPFI